MLSTRHIFNTMFTQNSERNGQSCRVIKVISVGKNRGYDLVKVRFTDGYIAECYRYELSVECEVDFCDDVKIEECEL